MKIRTNYEYPPIPDRSFDWSAVVEGEYEPGQPIGRGPTEDAAIADLQEQLDEREAAECAREEREREEWFAADLQDRWDAIRKGEEPDPRKTGDLPPYGDVE